MSLYNQIFGVNPYATGLLWLLGIDESEIPRFRDAFVNKDKQIVIMTRTGGKREEYEVPNGNLREVSGYLGDEDARFDSTYAYFRYEPSEDVADLVEEILEKQGEYDPDARWARFMADSKQGKVAPDTKRTTELGKTIVAQIEDGKTIIEV